MSFRVVFCGGEVVVFLGLLRLVCFFQERRTLVGRSKRVFELVCKGRCVVSCDRAAVRGGELPFVDRGALFHFPVVGGIASRALDELCGVSVGVIFVGGFGWKGGIVIEVLRGLESVLRFFCGPRPLFVWVDSFAHHAPQCPLFLCLQVAGVGMRRQDGFRLFDVCPVRVVVGTKEGGVGVVSCFVGTFLVRQVPAKCHAIVIDVVCLLYSRVDGYCLLVYPWEEVDGGVFFDVRDCGVVGQGFQLCFSLYWRFGVRAMYVCYAVKVWRVGSLWVEVRFCICYRVVFVESLPLRFFQVAGGDPVAQRYGCSLLADVGDVGVHFFVVRSFSVFVWWK